MIKRAQNMMSQDAIAWVGREVGYVLEEFVGSVSGVRETWDSNVLRLEFTAAGIAKFG